MSFNSPRFNLLRVADHPDYRRLAGLISAAVWPEFMLHDPVADEYWDYLFTAFAAYQFALYDAAAQRMAAFCNSVPLHWDKDWSELPEDGWDWALQHACEGHLAGVAPTCLCAIQISVSPDYQRKGLSTRMLASLYELARQQGFNELIAPVRPSLKGSYPLTPIERYITWKDESDLPFDPWLRVHARAGGRILKACHRAMRISGSLAEWQSWTGLRFPESGSYIIPGALVPVAMDVTQSRGSYLEPNVWVLHSLG